MRPGGMAQIDIGGSENEISVESRLFLDSGSP